MKYTYIKGIEVNPGLTRLLNRVLGGGSPQLKIAVILDYFITIQLLIQKHSIKPNFCLTTYFDSIALRLFFSCLFTTVKISDSSKIFIYKP